MKLDSLVARGFRPLSVALKNVDSLMARNDAVNVFVAQARRSELVGKELPSHMRISPRPLTGRRDAVRGPRHFRQSRLVQSRWPEDRMIEGTLPCLCCVVHGQADFYLGDYILHCQPGDFVFIPAGVPRGHFISNAVDHDPRHSCDVMYFHPGRLLGQGLECWVSHSQGDKVKSGTEHGAALIQSRFLASLFEQLGEEIQKTSSPPVRSILLRSLVLFLEREVETGRALVPTMRRLEQPVDEKHDPIESALSYIGSHLNQHLTIELLARKTALSPTRFKQLFRRATGTTFHRHLTAKRVEFAASLLRETDIAIQDVASHVGLKYTQFRKLFYIHYSCSPSIYRKQQSKK